MIIHIDFETRSTVELKTAGLAVYAAHPTTDVWCLGYAIGDDEPKVWVNGSDKYCPVVYHVIHGNPVVAHNAPFELAIWNEIMVPRYGWPPLPPEQVFCSMAEAYAMALPGALEKLAPALGIGIEKDMAGSRIMLQVSKPRDFTPEGEPIWWDDATKLERLYAYCKQDVVVERECHKRMRRLSPSERELWLLDYKINNRGIQIDVPAVKAAIDIVAIEKERMDKEMHRLTDCAVSTCSATGQITQWIKWQMPGIEIEGIAKGDVTQLLAMKDLPENVKVVLELRREAAKSSTAKLKSMLNRVNDDGRIRNTAQYHGAGTGRWAGRGIQTQNLPRPRIKQKEIEEVFKILEDVND